MYCPKYSKSTITLIDMKLNAVSNNDTRLEEPKVLESKDSNFYFSSSSKVTVNCTYKIKDSIYANASNYSVKIYIPDGAYVAEGSLYLDKKLCTSFNGENNSITIPVTAKSGKISFNLEIDEDCKLRTYAILNYRMNGKNDYDIIDAINEDVQLVTLNADDVVSKNTITLSGVAPAGKDVALYINDNKSTTVKANKASFYSVNLTLPNVEDQKNYVIKAETKDKNDTLIFAQKSVQYVVNAPELLSFTMDYNGKTYDLLSNKSERVTFILESFHGMTPFTFKAKYKNADNINHVVVTSTRNQLTKKMRLEYDKATDSYYAHGYFDETDHDYVPGKIKIKYCLNPDEEKIQKSLEDSIDFSYEDLPDEWKNAEITVKENTETAFEAEIKLEAQKTLVYTQNANLSLEDLNQMFFPEEYEDGSLIAPTGDDGNSDPNPAADFLKKLLKKFGKNIAKKTISTVQEEGEFPPLVVKDDSTNSIKTIVWDSARDAWVSCGVNFLGTKWIYDESIGISWKESGSAWGLIYGMAKPAYDLVVIDGEKLDIAKADVYNNKSLSAADREYALERINQVQYAYMGLTFAKMAVAGLNYYVSIHCGPAAPIVSLALGIVTDNLFGLMEDCLDDALLYFQSGGKGKLFDWSIDPSGYIYAGVTSNRVEGAKATAWWIPYDEEDEDFWENPDESKAVIWDASEYSQINPLITDNDGNYAWDVPEGLWKVVVEKDGYQTYSTGWLPVPPPQTDININLMSTTVPNLRSATYRNGVITLSFSDYVKPETMNHLVVKDNQGEIVGYTLNYGTDETDSEGNVFAKVYYLTINGNAPTDHTEYTVTVKNVESYSGVKKSEIVRQTSIAHVLGDVDNNGEVEIRDTTWIQRHATEMELPFTISKTTADVDGDGVLTVMDATAIQYYLANMKNPYHIGETV